MTTGFMLLDNPNPYKKQYSDPRRDGNVPSGTFVGHSTESAPDWVGPDTGAELVARWVALVRDTYGSYHEITDADSYIPMAPLYMETYHCTYTNKWSCGYSMAMQADKWHLMPEDRRNSMFRITAERIAVGIKWMKDERGIIVPVRHLTRAEAMLKKPGIIFHGETDPWRRSDPWIKHPNASVYTEYFLSLVAEALGQGGAITPPEPIPVEPAPVKPPVDYDPYNYSVNQVKGIQRALAYMGFYKYNIDGDYGYYTWLAVKTYQGVQVYWPGKVVDGYWGHKTWQHYDWTKELQETLNKWKGYDIRVDGDYGKVTVGRVRYTQERNRLYVDGIAGPETCGLLGMRTHP